MDNTRNDYGPGLGVQEPVTKDVGRVNYDLSHWSMKVGAIGSLQTLSVVPVVAGDSFALDAACVFRLSPLRRNLYLDCVVDLFAFYIPYRHIYGDDWISFMKSGYDEAVTLGTDTIGTPTDGKLECAGLKCQVGDPLPRWLTRGYVQIWNRYFRDPSDVAGLRAENYFVASATQAELDYGFNCAHLKRIWNSAILSTLNSSDYSLPLTGGEVDLYTLAALQGRLKTETSRDWFATRYQDILKHSWGTTVNIDADKRPELIMRTRQWLSGYDVDGTDDATLGLYSGKAATVANLKFPRKFFPEHGSLWIMGLLRFPPIHEDETHYLVTHPEPTYAQISGDPDVIRRSAPVDLQNGDIFVDFTGASLGLTPHSQWYREHPYNCHRLYIDAGAGHPFLNFSPTSRNASIYVTQSMYDEVFQSLQLKHWNAQCYINLQADRFIPDPRKSIFAGTGEL